MLENNYPLSRISVDIDRIDKTVFLNSVLEGQFNIKNITKGELCGDITSNVYGLRFIPSHFESNECIIRYEYEALYNIENINGEILIQSNGGEIIIPVSIYIKANELIENDFKINSLDSFVQYATAHFSEAKTIFFSDDFLEICNISSLNLIRLYKKLISSEHKQTAMENFLIASGKKETPTLKMIKPKIELLIKCFEDKKIKYKVPLNLVCNSKGWGSLDLSVSAKNNFKWLEVTTPNIKIDDIKNLSDLYISFIVDPNLIETKIVNNFIILDGGDFKISFELIIKKETIFSVETSKNYYEMNERGSIKIHNNSGEDIMLEIETYDKMIKFKSKKYFISAYAEIPFDITIYKTLEFRKVPVYSSTIAVKTIIKGTAYKKYLNIKIIDLRLKQIMINGDFYD